MHKLNVIFWHNEFLSYTLDLGRLCSTIRFESGMFLWHSIYLESGKTVERGKNNGCTSAVKNLLWNVMCNELCEDLLSLFTCCTVLSGYKE